MPHPGPEPDTGQGETSKGADSLPSPLSWASPAPVGSRAGHGAPGAVPTLVSQEDPSRWSL